MIILHVFSGWWLQITSVHSVWPNFYYHFSEIVLFLPGLWMLHPLLIEMVKLVPIYVCETFFFYEQLVGILVFTITFFIRKNLYTCNCCPCTVCSTSILCQCHSFDISSEISIHVWYILSVNMVAIVRKNIYIYRKETCKRIFVLKIFSNRHIDVSKVASRHLSVMFHLYGKWMYVLTH